MKIDAVELTLFAWDDIPPTKYTPGLAEPVGQEQPRAAADQNGCRHRGQRVPRLRHQPRRDRRRRAHPLPQADPDGQGSPGARGPACRHARPPAQHGPAQSVPATRRCGTSPPRRPACRSTSFSAARRAIGAYASSQVLESPQAYAEEAPVQGRRLESLQDPPTAPARGHQGVRGRAQSVGDAYTLMLNSTWSYRYPDALRVGRAIERLGYLWYEDPLNEEDIYSYVKLRQKLDIPILATEYPAGDIGTYAVWLTERATDYLRGDIPVKGGLTTMLKTAHLAEAFHTNYEVHHGGNSPTTWRRCTSPAPFPTPPSSRCCCRMARTNTGCSMTSRSGRTAWRTARKCPASAPSSIST